MPASAKNEPPAEEAPEGQGKRRRRRRKRKRGRAKAPEADGAVASTEAHGAPERVREAPSGGGDDPFDDLDALLIAE